MANEEVTRSTCFEVKKMKQGMAYTSKEKTIIMNVFKYFKTQYPEKNVTDIVRFTSKATGCSEKSIFSFRKEEISPLGFKEPSKKKIRTKVNINNRLIKYNESTQEQIRAVIYELKSRNINPSLSLILKSVNNNPNSPRFSIMTLRRLLSDIGFYYEKDGNKSILVEKVHSRERCKANDISTEKNQPTNRDRNINTNNKSSQISIYSNINDTMTYNASRENSQKISLNSHSFTPHSNLDKLSLIKSCENFQENSFINMNSNETSNFSAMFASKVAYSHSSIDSQTKKGYYLKEL